MTALYLCKVSCKCLTSAATWLGLPVVVCIWIPEWGWGCGDNVKAVNSAELNRGDDSSGRHHCTAFRRKSSDQASSSSITYNGQDESINFLDFYFLEMNNFIEEWKKDRIIFSRRFHDLSFSEKQYLKQEKKSLLYTWSLKGKLAKDGRFLAHFTAMKSNLALVS